ncbi:unnamed protein product [Penicillium nalgiovense]|uniref:Uncharacterized protein n=1 Tax=Penicillium nalgiovense TaxID=60175 RepID=A0A9W4IU00_PENNA|nr:unnamed protein product [Penicillium nalgiovense]CAG7949523.1 unnamed protein product [Penicillium nalgiovense]CAG7966647.1 unnamed protein product [Penicillium nalgiovense]CAG7985298.1 unnamed protein product [Penicillium nalgiovense]CAG8000473.1 unnamed protein product [Penicillium nalgiovense]
MAQRQISRAHVSALWSSARGNLVQESRTLCIPDPHPEFSPACPIPYVIQPSERVEQLKTFLQTEFGKAQCINVEDLIRLYENGDLKPRQPGETLVYLVDGRIVDKDPWEDPSVPNNAIK